MTSNLKSSEETLEEIQDDNNYEIPLEKTKSQFPKFREMISQYKRIGALTRYLIYIIALIVIAGLAVLAYEVFT